MQLKILKNQSAVITGYALLSMLLPFLLANIYAFNETNSFFLKSRQLVAITDTSALAGARLIGLIDNSIVVINATQNFNTNNSINASATFTLGKWDSENHTFTATNTLPNAIKVEATSPFIADTLAEYLEDLPTIQATSIALKSANSKASYIVQ